MRNALLAMSFFCALFASQKASAFDRKASAGAVFTMSDSATANAVLAYERAPDGSLELTGTYLTGGKGSGGGETVLGSQGSVTLSRNGRFLFVVNAGSDEVSSFRVEGSTLTLADVAPSGGMLPVSVTEEDGVVYVLNAGGLGNISGLRLDGQGHLSPLEGSTRPLSTPGGGPAEVSFDASGEVLAVTLKGAKALSLYEVDDDGRASAPGQVASSGATPFGFSFTKGDVLVVSEAGGGPSGTSAVSSYAVEDDTAELLSASVPNGQRAACWLVVTGDGRLAFVANAASGTISSYALDRQGDLTLLFGAAGILPPAGKPLDLALTRGDAFLYVLDTVNHGIAGFANLGGGALEALGESASSLPLSAVGMAAR